MSNNAILFLIVSLFGFVLPIVLIIWWKRKTGVKIGPFLVGTVCFLIFAGFLESLLHQYVLYGDNFISSAILSNKILFVLYGVFAAGIFEETGRYIGFTYFLKKEEKGANAIAYGLGHGGIEIVTVLATTYLIYALILFGVDFGTGTNEVIKVAESINVGYILLAVLERCSALMIHVGLSCFVFIAVKKKGKFKYYPFAILLHALADVPACMYQIGIIKSLIIVEILILVAGVACLYFGYNKLKKEMEI